ncbi:hypothetical protein Poli38472_013417 [Pythium oligandrum]|uniref:FHA domain-containing protein n=1 Tax=Pythium oligandrum TaxID=41045 RepID=A0A8K1FGN5_PYTOL|nr:hypothetical protein Poli38472_013417 [Pythium oligandrum]|eukprot:TMW57943.1 hypothetical protein Poli38472_013417 [Pythium oligandrum]
MYRIDVHFRKSAQMATVEERKKALEKKFVEARPPLAYAKLSGRVADDVPFEMLLTQLPVELGRGPLSTTPSTRICLGEHKAISRKHVSIQWNQDKSCFELQCLGKNGMFAAGKFVPKDKTVDLASKMPIKIGPARLYFLAAIRSTCSTMSGFKLLQRAFEKAKSQGKDANGLTVDELVQQVLDMFPKSEPELGGKENLRSFIASYLIEDDQNFERVSTAEPARYKMKATATAAGSALGKTPLDASAESEAARKKQKTADP